MEGFLCDLYGHQAWADAEHVRIISAHPASASDNEIQTRLYHYLLTQRAFLMIAKSEDLSFPHVMAVPPMDEMKCTARRFHEEAIAFIAGVDSARLAEQARIPWFRNPQLEISIEQGLIQAAMHSHYHRGQNAMRLRQLGIEPPQTDLIAWWWIGRPAPQWE